MELREAIGNRRSIRYYKWWQPVEREKIQVMLEGARLATFWGNVALLRAVVVDNTQPPAGFKEAMLAFNQVHVQQAPVILVWYIDTNLMGNPDYFKKRLKQLVDVKALNPTHGWSHRFIDRMVSGETSGQPSPQLGPEDDLFALTMRDAGCGIAHALLLAVEMGLGVCLIDGDKRKIRELLGLPEGCLICGMTTVGYPLEDPLTGGQRPRPPFEEMFWWNRYGNPFPRNSVVEEQLRKDKMLQAEAPLPWREAEIRALARMLGLPE